MHAQRTPALLIAIALLLTACSSSREFQNENDRLRARVLELEQQLAKVQAAATELESQVAAASVRPDSVPEEVARNTPQIARITLGRLTHARDDDGDGRVDSIMLFVKPEDSRGRFIQIVGMVAVHAAVLPADAEAATIGRATFDPGQVRDAYRAGIAGLHYSFIVPIEPTQDTTEAMVRLVFTDGHTGREHTAERAVPLK